MIERGEIWVIVDSLSQSLALTIALPANYFRRLGLPSLVNG
jgi:hypothetical protein